MVFWFVICYLVTRYLSPFLELLTQFHCPLKRDTRGCGHLRPLKELRLCDAGVSGIYYLVYRSFHVGTWTLDSSVR